MGVIVWPTSPPLGGKTKDEIIGLLRQALHGRVEAAYIFGSLARGELHSTSDVDLIVVKETGKPFVERCRDFDDLWKIFNRLDLLVYTPAEFKAQLESKTPGFWKSVAEEVQQII